MNSFSIIIPVYNAEDYIIECLNSIISQSYGDYEIICIDDGSTDQSIAKIRSVCSDKIVVAESVNLGQGSARNIGLGLATKDFVWFVDADDFIGHDALHTISKHLSHSDVDVLAFSYSVFNHSVMKDGYKLHFNDDVITGKQYIDQSQFFLTAPWVYVYKRSFLAHNNAKFKTGIYHEDDYFNISIFGKIKRLKSIADALYFYRVGQDSTTSNQSVTTISKRVFSYFELIKLTDEISDLEPTFLLKKRTAYIRNIFILLDSQIKHNPKNGEVIDLVNKVKKWMKDANVKFPITDKYSLIRRIFFISDTTYIFILKRFNI